MTIRSATEKDAARITEIYNYYVRYTTVTFEEHPVSAGAMRERIESIQTNYPYLVGVRDGSVQGFAYATRWKARGAYRNTVETTIYVAPEATGQGIGSQLYPALIEALQEQSRHVLLAGIALPNEGSVTLHEKLGFQKVGQLREVGWKMGKWVDVGYWELILPDVPRDGAEL